MTFQDYIAARKRDLRGVGSAKLQEQLEVEAMVIAQQDLMNACLVARDVAFAACGEYNVTIEEVLRVNLLMQTYAVSAYRSLIAKGEIQPPGVEEDDLPITVEEAPPKKGSN